MGLSAAGQEVLNGGKRTGQLAHVLMLPFEEEGHFTAFLQLLYFLSSLEITVTCCTSRRRVIQLRKLQSKGELKGLDLRLVELSEDVSKSADAPGALPPLWVIPKIMKVQFQRYREKLAAETNPDAKPTCLIADLFLNWTEELAGELQIPRYLLFTTAGWFPFVTLKAKVENWKKVGDEIVDIPGHSSARGKEIPSILFPLMNLQNLAGILINTFEELEGDGILEAIRAYLQKMKTTPESKVPRFLPIGPMVHLPGYPAPTRDAGADTQTKALQWLDEQAPSSVLYIAFGTMANISAPLIFELARGLELSRVPFLWVLRSSTSTTDISTLVPPGFLDRVGKRGFVETAWAPQFQILQHSSTGGFMSHCGWNSSMESIFSGVPILTWPMHGDQPVNARYIVEGVKVGLAVRKQESPDLVVSGEDVAAAVRSLMVNEEGNEVRKNSVRLKELAWGSMEDGGSSHRNLRLFTDDILVK